jgi:hypothetical protein
MTLDYREAAWAIWMSTYERTGCAEQAYDAAAFILRIHESRQLQALENKAAAGAAGISPGVPDEPPAEAATAGWNCP